MLMVKQGGLGLARGLTAAAGGGSQDEGDKMLVVERGDLVFVFNFHPVSSFSDYRVGAYLPGPYKACPCQLLLHEMQG